MALPVPAREVLTFKDEKEFRYIGKGEVQIYDLHDITDRQGGLRRRRQRSGHEVRRRRASAGGRRHGQVRSTMPRRLQGAGRRADRRAIPGAPPGEVQAARRRRGRRQRTPGRRSKAGDALKIEWDDGPHARLQHAMYEQGAARLRRRSPARRCATRATPMPRFAGAAKTFTREYYQPHMVHAPMEPPAALANVSGGKCEVWACLQSPYGARAAMSPTSLGMEPENVTVHVTLLGGGFGRKSKCDFAIEAAYLSKEVGAPVPRAVDPRGRHPARLLPHHLGGADRHGLDADRQGDRLAASERAPSVPVDLRAGRGLPAPDRVRHGLGGRAVRHPERARRDSARRWRTRGSAGSARCRTFRAPSPSSRSRRSWPPSSARTRRSFLLEMIGAPRTIDSQTAGHAAGFLELRRAERRVPDRHGPAARRRRDRRRQGRLGQDACRRARARHRRAPELRVLHCDRRSRQGRRKDGKVRVPEVHVAIDCGFVANPERVRSQMEGACVYGMTAAIYSAITYENGARPAEQLQRLRCCAATTSRRWCTSTSGAPFSVHATGVGEPGVPPFAPALCNAIFNATGKRMRSLPVSQHDLSWS